MKMKRFLSIVVTLCMVLSLLPVGTLATVDAPQLVNGYYEIYTADQLYWFAEQVNTGNDSINGKLMADIVVNENVLNADGTLNGDGSDFRVWTPIGGEENQYNGAFDGNGKTVSGLFVNDTSKSYVGLFGCLGYNGTITQVGIEGNYLNAYVNIGGIVGYAYGSISYCYNTGSINGRGAVGGVAGYVEDGGSIHYCYNTGNINARGGYYIGGVVGYLGYYCTMKSCYNAGIITFSGTESWSVGGVVGGFYNNDTIGNCYYLQAEGLNGYVGTAVTIDQFASGEVCWLLSGSPMPVKAKKEADENPWGQKIGKDSHPVFSEDKVIPVVDQGGNILGYQNEVSGVTVSGNVTSYLAGDTTVELIQNGEVAYSVTVSGSEYAIEGVVAGDYTLRVTKANHIPQEYAITVGQEPLFQDATICPIGDVTGDGVVNIKDFQRLLRHVNKTNPLTDYELACGDVTGDGVVNIKDFQRLLRHVNKTNPLF